MGKRPSGCLRRRMGFDVLYLPPIHPIGTSFRKGPNNTLNAGPNDPGSPWAIGGAGRRTQGGPRRAGDHRRLRSPRAGGARGWASRSPSTSPSSARPTIPTCASIPSGSATAPTARSSTPRTRREISGHLPDRLRIADWRVAWEEAGGRLRVLDRSRRVDLPRGEPSHEAVRFWDWVIDEVCASIPTRSSSPRRSPDRR